MLCFGDRFCRNIKSYRLAVIGFCPSRCTTSGFHFRCQFRSIIINNRTFSGFLKRFQFFLRECFISLKIIYCIDSPCLLLSYMSAK